MDPRAPSGTRWLEPTEKCVNCDGRGFFESQFGSVLDNWTHVARMNIWAKECFICKGDGKVWPKELIQLEIAI